MKGSGDILVKLKEVIEDPARLAIGILRMRLKKNSCNSDRSRSWWCSVIRCSQLGLKTALIEKILVLGHLFKC